jgi:hypothetical protein
MRGGGPTLAVTAKGPWRHMLRFLQQSTAEVDLIPCLHALALQCQRLARRDATRRDIFVEATVYLRQTKTPTGCIGFEQQDTTAPGSCASAHGNETGTAPGGRCEFDGHERGQGGASWWGAGARDARSCGRERTTDGTREERPGWPLAGRVRGWHEAGGGGQMALDARGRTHFIGRPVGRNEAGREPVCIAFACLGGFHFSRVAPTGHGRMGR